MTTNVVAADELRSDKTDNVSTETKMCIDDVLHHHAGEFGRWQLRQFLLVSLAWAVEAFHTMVMIFADREPAWRCVDATLAGACPPDPCHLAPAQWEWVGGAAVSTVAEWGLICGHKYKVGLVQSAFFGGCMIGNGLFGHLSDSFLGRKGTLIVACVLITVVGFFTSLSPSYPLYALLRFLTGFSTGRLGLCAFVLATKPFGPTKRDIIGMSNFYFFPCGIVVLSGIAFLFPTWRALYVATSVPTILFIIVVLPFITESPRWFLIRGKYNKAMDIIQMISATNRRQLPNELSLKLDNDEVGTNKDAITGSVIDILRSSITRYRLVLSVTINFACSIVFFGLSLNVGKLNTNLYISVLLNALAEMHAYALTTLLLNKFGRKPLTVGSMWLSGLFCVVSSVVGGTGAMKVVQLVCGVLGIFGAAATYSLLCVYTTELFPTIVRSAALGCTSHAGQLGAILAPFMVVFGNGLSIMVFGVCGLVGGLLAIFLPETMNRPLYDTIDGLERGESASLYVVENV